MGACQCQIVIHSQKELVISEMDEIVNHKMFKYE